MRKIIAVVTPFILVVTAWTLAIKSESMGVAAQSLFSVLPYVFAVLAIILSTWYQNSNSFFFTCLLLISYIYMTVLSKTPAMLFETISILSVLLPINAVWLSFSQERGIISTYGRNKAIIIGAQVLWALISIMTKSSIKIPAEFSLPIINLKAPAIVLYIVCIFVLLMNYIFKGQYLSLIFVAVLIETFIMLHFAHRHLIVAIFMSSIFVIMVLALIEIFYSLAFYDPLTGVFSRRALEQEFLKLRGSYIIAMVDLDHFKKINDTYGHDVGDQVLKMVATVLRQYAGTSRVFRYGGEEFVAIFTEMSYNQAVFKMDNVRKLIANRKFVIRDKNRPEVKPDNVTTSHNAFQNTINITVSIGLSQKNNLLKTPYEVLKKADEALYKSKNSGRNCITKI